MEFVSHSAAESALETLFDKARADESFKQELMNNPRAVIQQTVNIAFPENVKIVVRDQSNPTNAYINIPRQPDPEAMELTDEQLEMVAGGDITLGAVLLYAGCALLVGAIVGAGAYAATH